MSNTLFFAIALLIIGIGIILPAISLYLLRRSGNMGTDEFHYISHYSLDLCLEYMKHDNIYDRFKYEWEKRGEDYFITFMEYKSSMRSLANAPKPTFKVAFENMGNQTGITVQFVKGVLQPSPFVYGKDVDIFWEKKLDAKKA